MKMLILDPHLASASDGRDRGNGHRVGGALFNDLNRASRNAYGSRYSSIEF